MCRETKVDDLHPLEVVHMDVKPWVPSGVTRHCKGTLLVLNIVVLLSPQYPNPCFIILTY